MGSSWQRVQQSKVHDWLSNLQSACCYVDSTMRISQINIMLNIIFEGFRKEQGNLSSLTSVEEVRLARSLPKRTTC